MSLMKDVVNETDPIETTKKLKHSYGWFLMIGELMHCFFTKNRLNTTNTDNYALIVMSKF